MASATEDRKAEELVEVLADFVEQTRAVRPKMPCLFLLLPWKTSPVDGRFPGGATNIINCFGSVTAIVRDPDEASAIVDRMNSLGRS